MKKSSLGVTLIGGPTAVVELGGLRFLTDPTFDAGDSVYDLGAVTLRKKLPPAIRPETLGHIDAVLLSHDQHSDNLDRLGREFLDEAKSVFTTVAGAGRLGGNSRGLSCWETVSLDSPSGATIDITATPCRHGPAGIGPITGDVTGFVLEVRDGGRKTVYITGDTVYFEGVAEVARRFSPQLVLAFAGAARTRGPFNLTMSTNDVLDTAHAFPQSLIVPVHIDGWEHFTESGEELKAAFAALKIPGRLKVIVPGETYSV